MKSNPFQEVISYSTLRFRLSHLEKEYKKTFANYYLSMQLLFYFIMIIIALFDITISCQAYIYYINDSKFAYYGQIVTIIFMTLSIILEILINAFDNLQLIRGIPFGILICSVCTVGNVTMESTPTSRPG